MSITISPCLLKRKKKRDGSIPIYLRLTQNRKSRYLSTGLTVKENEWDDKNHKVRKSHRNYRQLNKYLTKLLDDAERKYLELSAEKSITSKELKSQVKDKSSNHLLVLLDKHIYELKAEGRLFESRKAKVLRKNFAEFKKLAEQDILVQDIDSKFVEEFQDYVRGVKKNNPNTTIRKMNTFRRFITSIRKKGIIQHNPFDLVKVVSSTPANRTKLTLEQIDAISKLDLEKGSALWHTRNYFMYSFYNAGIRFGDLCSLKWENIVDGRLIYRMHKTGGSKSIKQMDYHYGILKHYRKEDSKPDDYIFPILKKKHDDPIELRKEIASRNVVANRNLKKIAKMAKIQADVSFHIARHSFSQFALKKGIDIYSISKALGHSDIKVTQAYLSSFDEDLLDKSMDKLFGDS